MNCLIYGAGHLYNRIISIIKLTKGLDIIGIVTTDATQYEYLDGYKRYKADRVDWGQTDLVIIAVEDWEPVYRILKEYGVPKSKIVKGKVFELPYFDLQDYLTVKNSDPSIIANTCLGGRVYKELGFRMSSPCINMACVNDAYYIGFLKDILSGKQLEISGLPQKDKPEHDGIYANKVKFLPTGIVNGKYEWYFPHDNLDAGISNWNRRKDRINYSNLSAAMIAFSDKGAEAFDRLGFERKVCFYYRDLHLDSVVYTPEWNDPNVQRAYDFNYQIFIHRYATNIEGKGRVDWIRFLKGEKDYLRW